MERLVLEGNKYKAVFLDAEKQEEKNYEYTCWHTSPDMWWKGKIIITDKIKSGQVRATFETFHRANVNGGIRDETLEESLLLVRGKTNDGGYVSYKGGIEVVTDMVEVIDYLLEGVYDEAREHSQREFLPHVKIPLLEQHDLAKRGYARLEQIASIETR